MNNPVGRALSRAAVAAGWMGVSIAHAFSPATFPAPETPASPGWTVSVRALAGVLSGQAEELVYDDSRKLSELQWDLSGVGMGGLSVAVQPHPLWTVYGSWVAALSPGAGEMKDYDWQVEDLAWTDYSRSEVDVDSMWMGDVGISRQLTHGHRLNMRAVAGFMSQQWEWSDRGQEYIYSVDGFRDTRGSFGGIPLIQYKQTYEIPYLGAQLGGEAGPWAWSAYFLYGPYIWAEDRDYHIGRDVHFEGSFSGGSWMGVGFAAEYRITPAWTLAGGLHVQSIPEFKGDMRIVELNETYSDSAAVSHESAALTVSMRWGF